MARAIWVMVWWMVASSAAWAQLPAAPPLTAPAALSQWLAAESHHDFGDYGPQTLVSKAWKALDEHDAGAVEAFTALCITLYEADARTQQAGLKTWPAPERMGEAWALNDVATAYFILGESLRERERYAEAKQAFQRILKEFPLAQCWDPKGWYWSVAEGARVRLEVMR